MSIYLRFIRDLGGIEEWEFEMDGFFSKNLYLFLFEMEFSFDI